MILRDVQHSPCFRRQLVEHLGGVAHDCRSQTVRITEKLKICGGKMTVRFAVLRPFASAFFVGNKQVRGSAEEQIPLTDSLFGFLHFPVVEITEAEQKKE